jgi:hypothetical protein
LRRALDVRHKRFWGSRRKLNFAPEKVTSVAGRRWFHFGFQSPDFASADLAVFQHQEVKGFS